MHEPAPDDRWQAAVDIAHAIALPVTTPPTPRLGRTRWFYAAAALLISGAALLIGLWLGRTPAPREVVSFAIYPPPKTAFSGNLSGTLNVPQFALSPDGHTVVFAAGAEGDRPILWRRAIDDVTAQALAGTENAEYPFWSPDSRWIGFYADGKLKKVSVAGGAVQVVVPDVCRLRGASWGQDGTIVFANGGAGPIRGVAAAGGEPALLTTVAPDESGHRFPQLLPDGRHFLYLALGPGQKGLYAGSLDAKDRTLLARIDNSAEYAVPGYLLFVQGNTLFAEPFDAAGLRVTGPPLPIAEHAGRTSTFKSAVSALVYRSHRLRRHPLAERQSGLV